jgi:hypothetical protein
MHINQMAFGVARTRAEPDLSQGSEARIVVEQSRDIEQALDLPGKRKLFPARRVVR